MVESFKEFLKESDITHIMWAKHPQHTGGKWVDLAGKSKESDAVMNAWKNKDKNLQMKLLAKHKHPDKDESEMTNETTTSPKHLAMLNGHETHARKVGGKWLVGGDVVSKGDRVQIMANRKHDYFDPEKGKLVDRLAWHKLKGSHLAFDDYASKEDIEKHNKLRQESLQEHEEFKTKDGETIKTLHFKHHDEKTAEKFWRGTHDLHVTHEVPGGHRSSMAGSDISDTNSAFHRAWHPKHANTGHIVGVSIKHKNAEKPVRELAKKHGMEELPDYKDFTDEYHKHHADKK